MASQRFRSASFHDSRHRTTIIDIHLMTSTLHIELTSPQAVDGKRAPYQSLWLLVRLHYAQRFEATARVIRLAELRQQFTDARSLRMFISRAFKDFVRWGVQVGWGEDAGGDPRFLNQDRRSQGPFWLPSAESERIVCMVEGVPATQAELLGFLGMKRKSDVPAATLPVPMPADFWAVLAGAQQHLRQGRLLAALDEHGGVGRHIGALAGFKEASTLAGNRLQRALAALGEAQVWRRLDDLDAARKTLTQLRRVLKEGGADEGGYLDAMEQILTAWCAYSERDFVLTEALLAAMRHTEPRAAVVRHHPRIRSEWHNLMALLKRAHALDHGAGDAATLAQRQSAAMEAMRHFAAALDAAFEFGSFDAAQQVAANVGMATWLFACEGLIGGGDPASMRPEALRWLLLSEWLCGCAGLSGQSAWNAIYLMRIARGDTAHGPRMSLAGFRALRPLQPAELIGHVGDFSRVDAAPLLPSSWRALAEQLLARQRQGESRYSALQRCGLWLEHAWYAAHAGDLPAAVQSLAHLHEELPHLPASDKAFFESAQHRLPIELFTDTSR
jgi:hypothetical protein